MRITQLVLEIGQFSGVESGALEFAFNLLKKGTILAEAEIIYLTPPLVLFCKNCENEYIGDWEDLRCPSCLETQFEVIQGREMIVKSIEGETQ